MRLMGKKIAVSQSTSGDIPDNGLDSLNTEEQSIAKLSFFKMSFQASQHLSTISS
jgi:hypothetical protein